jgi:hypothetical protein
MDWIIRRGDTARDRGRDEDRERGKTKRLLRGLVSPFVA